MSGGPPEAASRFATIGTPDVDANAPPAGDATSIAYGRVRPASASSSFAVANTSSGPVTSSNCTGSNATIVTRCGVAPLAARDMASVSDDE